MTNASRPAESPLELDVSYRVAGWSMLRLAREEIASLRKGPPGFFPANARVISLKHSDEQTIAGLAAVFGAIRDFGLTETDFGSWGVVAAPRFLGREVVSHTLDRYAIDGAWGISMQLVPHFTLHAQASTISLALGAHGPSIGAGGGVGSEAESALTTLGFLDRQPNQGMWLLWTGWEPELAPIPGGQEAPAPDCRCLALALAIQGLAPAHDASRFRVRAAGGQGAAERLAEHHPAVAAHPAVDRPAAADRPAPRRAAKSGPARALNLVDQACRRSAASLSLEFDLGGGLRQELQLRPPAPARGVPAPHRAAFEGLTSLDASPSAKT